MIRRPTICLLLAALLLGPLSATSIAAAQECDRDCALGLVRSGQILPLGQLIVSAGLAQRGEILDAQLFERNGRWLYALRLLNRADNNVFGVVVDASTGAVVSGPR